MNRSETATPGVAGTFGVGDDGQLPARGNVRFATEYRARGARAWLGGLLRNAAIAIALMTAVPLIAVSVNGDSVWRMVQYSGNTRAKTVIAERARPLALPRDASITPTQAGLAFARLQPARRNPGMPMLAPESRPVRSWEALALTNTMFLTARPDVYGSGPSSNAILEAVAKGFSPAEREYLRALATAPVWKDFDLVARAPAMDMVGGLLRFPLPAEARWEELPIAQFRVTKDLAYAAVSRAAYHLSIGQRDSAEAALRAVVSFGFAMIDNSTNLMDQLVGDVIVGIGRDGLQRFYKITGDARAASIAVTPVTKAEADANLAAFRAMTPGQVRRYVIDRATDPATPRGERFELVRMLSMSSCSNARETLLGPREDVRAAIATAGAMLGRYSSERELVRLASTPMTLRSRDVVGQPVEAMLASIATVPAVVLNKPQLATCTLIASQRVFGP